MSSVEIRDGKSSQRAPSLRAGRPRVFGVHRQPDGRIQQRAAHQGDVAYVYVLIFDGRIGCKIGYSNDVGYRVTQAQIFNEGVVRLFWTCTGTKANMSQLERRCHRALKGTRHHIRGEFYALNPQEAALFVVKMARVHGFEISRAEKYGAFHLNRADDRNIESQIEVWHEGLPKYTSHTRLQVGK